MLGFSAAPQIIANACPKCPKCGSTMSLTYILPHKPGHDKRTYECQRCDYEITELIKYR